MRIAVNTRLLLPGRLEGIGWFTYETLKRLTSKRPEHEFIFLFDRPFSDEFIFQDNVTGVSAGPPSRHPILWWWWFEQTVPRQLKKHKADLFLSPDGYGSLRSTLPSVVVIHDINFEHFPEDLPPVYRWYYRHYTPQYARHASRVATVSKFSQWDICKEYGVHQSKVDIVYNGANELYAPIEEATQVATREQYAEGLPYFLFVGSLHPRKNLARLFMAYDQFCHETDHPARLLIVGEKKWWTTEIRTAFDKMKHQDRVIFTGRLAPEELKNVIASALAMVYVSYFEGFGIPILEGFYCEVPVVTSNKTSMPEIAGGAALLVDPFEVNSIAQGLKTIASDAQLRTELVEKGRIRRQDFTWDGAADRLWQSIEKALDKSD